VSTFSHSWMRLYFCICVFLCVFIFVCVCVCLSVYVSICLLVCLSITCLFVCTSVCQSVCLSVYLDRKNPPPPGGGFLFTMFPHQEPCVRGPPSKDLYQVLRGGSSYTRFLMREHSKKESPPGGGVSFDHSVCLSVCLSVFLSVCPSVCLFVCLSICLSIYLSVCLTGLEVVWYFSHDYSAYLFSIPGVSCVNTEGLSTQQIEALTLLGSQGFTSFCQQMGFFLSYQGLFLSIEKSLFVYKSKRMHSWAPKVSPLSFKRRVSVCLGKVSFCLWRILFSSTNRSARILGLPWLLSIYRWVTRCRRKSLF